MYKKLSSFLALVGLSCLIASNASAAWIDWTSTSTGTITIDGSSIGVSLSGDVYDYVNGDYYFNNAATGGISPGGTYGGLQPSDLIQINSITTITMTFDTAIIDPYIALVSVGQTGLPVTYGFNDPFSVVSSGSNYWGYGGYSVTDNNFTGREFNGVLQMSGSYSSISFDISPAEFWHGFNIGSTGVASVPETNTLFLLAIGLLGVGASRMRQIK